MSLFSLFFKRQKNAEPPKQFKLSSKTFYSVEVAILEQYFPLSEKIHREMLGVYDNQRSYVTYYFDGPLPVAVILWLDDWKSKISEEERLEFFTLMDEPFTQSAYIAAFEVNSFYHDQGYGRAVLKDFVKSKNFVTLSAIDGSEGFYKRCGFNVDKINNYFFWQKDQE